jgi:cold shock protein
MTTGTIKKIMDGKDFGFISSTNLPKDLFFHKNGVAAGTDFGSLAEGDTVSFDIEKSDKGDNAVNVTKA